MPRAQLLLARVVYQSGQQLAATRRAELVPIISRRFLARCFRSRLDIGTNARLAIADYERRHARQHSRFTMNCKITQFRHATSARARAT